MIDRQRDTIFTPNIKMFADKYTSNYSCVNYMKQFVGHITKREPLTTADVLVLGYGLWVRVLVRVWVMVRVRVWIRVWVRVWIRV